MSGGTRTVVHCGHGRYGAAMSAAHAGEGLRCSVRAIQPLVGFFQRRGLPLEALLAAAGIEAAQLTDVDRRFPAEGFLAAWALAQTLTGDDALGLHVAEALEPEHTTLIAYLAASSATGREAYRRSTRFTRIVADFLGFELDDDGPRSVCRIVTPPGVALPHGYAEFILALMVRLAPTIVGDTSGLEAWIARAEPADRSEHDRILGVPLRFGEPCYAICGRTARLDRPLPRADANLAAFLESQAQEALDRVPADDDVVTRVRRAIAAELPHGNPGVDGVAGALGTTGRSLRRRLSAEGTSHRQLLDQVRSELALRALDEGELSLGEVAFLVGYSDASAFHKAFRRWTGQSPRDYRRS